MISSGYGDLAVISGFAAGDVIDDTVIGAGATLRTAVVNGNTVGTITGGGAINQLYTFAGLVASYLTLTSDGDGGEQISYVAPPPTTTIVSSGTTESDLMVNSGSTLDVLAGGTIVSASIFSSGTATVSGVDDDSTVFAGGNELVLGSATGDLIYGTQLVSLGTAVVNSETVFNGGAVDLYLKGAVANGLALSGGTLNISGNATATNTKVTGGGMINLQSPKANLSGSLTFSGAGPLEETVVVSSGYGDFAVISGFGAGDAIDLTAIGTGATLSSAVNSNGNTVETVTSGGVSESFVFNGGYTSGYFNLTPDAATGVMITAEGTPCYCPGTCILTDKGEVAVEDLRIGDRLVTLAGAVRPIRWIGNRAYSGRFASGKTQILPILINAGALGGGLPRRDLMVSPLHALFIDGVLIPASALVNGTTIIQPAAVESVAYFHVELETHDVILAEGAAAESFVDDDSRGMFHNAAEYRRLYPHAMQSPARYCAPRMEDGALVDAVRRRLAGQSTPPRGRLSGHIDAATRGRIQGWARDEAAAGEPVRLRIIANDVVLFEVMADQYRRDLAAAGIGNGHHAFDVTIPGGLPAQGPHLIQVQRASDGAPLAELRCA